MMTRGIWVGAIALATTLTTMGEAAFVAPLEHVISSKAPLLESVSDLTATTVDGDRVFLFGGCSESVGGACQELTNKAYFYYPLEDRYEEIPVPGSIAARYRHAATVVGDVVYILGGATALGDNEGFSNRIVTYNFASNSWSQLPTRLPTGVSDGTAFSLFGKVHFVGGWVPGYAHNSDTFILDPSNNNLETTTGLALDRGDTGSAVLDDRAYVLGGYANSEGHVGAVEVFDGLTGTWSELPVDQHLSAARGDKAVAVMNGLVYVLGGQTESGTAATEVVEVFDPASQKWSFGGRIPGARYRFAAAQHGESIFLFGGEDPTTNSTLATVEAFTVTSGIYSQPTLTLHGSGTTNPSNLFWEIIHTLESSSRVPLKVSYRAVGSSTGQREFLGDEASAFLPYTQFGSGDLPLSSDQYAQVTEHGHEVAQLPFGFGAIGVYVNIPEQRAVQGRKVVIPACELAKIYQGTVTKWSDLADASPENSWLEGVDEVIKPVHRVLGSSSTSGITNYMNAGCPAEWPADLVQKKLDPWPCGNGCQGEFGSSKVQEYIRSTPYAIGYLSVGHGYPDELREAALVNKAGNTVLFSTKGVQDAAAAYQDWPTSAFDSFADVSLINSDGGDTWPIVLVSYVYARKDLTSLGSSGALLKAFLTYLFDEAAGQEVMQDYNFIPLDQTTLAMVKAGIAELVLAPGVTEFSFETSTDPINGAGPFVLSGKRENFADQVREDTAAEIQTLSKQVDQLSASLGSPDHEHDFHEEIDEARAIAIAGLIFALFDFAILICILMCVASLRREMLHHRKLRKESAKSIPLTKERQDSQVSESSNQSESAAVRQLAQV